MIASPHALRINLPTESIAGFCRRWRISRLEVFGSALRHDFRPDSDVDFIATYAVHARWSLLDRARMILELEAMLGRPVDLLNRHALEKAKASGRARHILDQAQRVYDES